MLLTETVIVKWSNQNKKYYINLGYTFTNYNDEFEVKVADISKGSHINVVILCDYCKIETKTLYYAKYNSNHKHNPNDSCNHCLSKHRSFSFDYNNRKPRRYWENRDNRLKELKLYLDEYVSFEHAYSNGKGHNLITQFKKYNDDINSAIKELGYSDNCLYLTKDYYTDINNLADLIKPIIKKYERFPTYTEISNELGFKSKILGLRENLAKIKQILNYHDENDLVDDRGFLNRSSYEYITAQFLIYNNKPYRREQRPFSETNEGTNYRSDFTLYSVDNKEIHLEIWGLVDTYDYDKKMKDKMDLYHKYNISLISLYPSDFLGKYEDIQNILQLKLSALLNEEFKIVEQKVLIPGTKMSDEEILNKIMEYSDDGITFPSYDKLKFERQNTLYLNVLKRYSSMSEFAEKYGKIPHDTPMNYWNKERIFSVFEDKLNRDGFLGSYKDMNNFRGSFSSIVINRYKSGLYAKIEFYKWYINKGKRLPIKEIEYIRNILIKGRYGVKTILSKENINDIQNILSAMK